MVCGAAMVIVVRRAAAVLLPTRRTVVCCTAVGCNDVDYAAAGIQVWADRRPVTVVFRSAVSCGAASIGVQSGGIRVTAAVAVV